MIQMDGLVAALVSVMPDPTAIQTPGSQTDQEIDAEVRKIIASAGIDPDALEAMAKGVVMMAVEAGQDPESTVIGAFQTGAALVIALYRKGMLTAP